MIPLLPVEESKRRAKEVGIDEQFGSLNVFRAFLHNPTVAGPIANYLTTLLFRGKLEARIRELIILRIGWRSASEYEFCQHVQVAKRAGMSDEEILGARNPQSCASYSELDRAILRMTDELIDSANVSPEVWAKIEKAFAPEQLVELLLVVGNWRMFAIFLNAAKIPLDANVPTWPEGKAPR
jgi:alkylhydroperoxidase family enzyme